MSTYAIRTFGCQMNHSDSERVSQVMQKAGFKLTEEDLADLLIVNTCSVRQKAEDKAYGFMTKHKRANKNVKIAITGCMVRQTGDRENSRDPLFSFDSIDIAFRIEDTARMPKLLERHFREHDFSQFEEAFGDGSIENYFNIVPKVENKAQVFVPIMQGCDKFCTYCIVPFTRGREISRPLEDVLAECKVLVEAGAKEITLLGQNVNSYKDGEKGEKCFAKLLLEVDKLHVMGLSRTRFTSAHPQDFTDDVIDALAHMKTRCPYIHLPVQHGSNQTLRAMNRNYTIDKYNDIIAKIRTAMPDTTLATDIIVGFPGETEEQFQELCDFADELKLDFSYTAIFSPRKHTPAARMEKEFIDMEEKKSRFHRFDEIVKKHAFAQRAKFVGKEVEVLVEKSEVAENGLYRNAGRTREFFEVWFLAGRPLKGKEVMVTLDEQKGYVFSGTMPEVEAILYAAPALLKVLAV